MTMRSTFIVIVLVVEEQSLEMVLAEDHDMVEALSSD